MRARLSRAVAAVEARFPWTERVTGPFHRHRWLRWTAGTFTVLALLGFVAFNALWFSLELPETPPHPQSALVLTSDGQELAAFAPDGLRLRTKLEDIAPVAVQAVLAAEDRRFYEHGGVDPFGIARAVWRDARGGRQGGSTITQQLVKVDYLTSERSIWRKVKEAVLAVKLDRTADKDEILERYLNTVYFGRNAYGIDAAARAYFNVTAAELQPVQAALLAGLIRSPETADPVESPEAAIRRRSLVLNAMVEEHVLSKGEGAALVHAPLGAVPPVRRDIDAKAAPHFVDYVRQQAIDAVGEKALNAAGLRIITTLDLRAQRAAEQAVAAALTQPTDPQAALVALDTDGAVRAYVGGRDHDRLKVDLLRGKAGGGSGRQPGSTFKPIVLAAALDKGVTLGQRFSAPPHLEVQVDGQPWDVDNYGGESFGTIDVAKATAHSVNTVYAQLLQRVGPKAVVDEAHRLGIDSELDAVPSIALGAAEVSPLELASAYATFADDGKGVTPYAIQRIEDADGDTIWTPDRPAQEQRIRPEVARTVTRALEGVIADGTARAARLGRPAAGKTGTTQNNVDAWFAGYVPGYTAVVWMGNPDGAIPMAARGGRAVTGGGIPARIWAAYMKVALDGRKVEDFPGPPADLLAAPPPPTLRVEPSPATPGGTLTVTGDGFEACSTAWWVQLDGTFLASQPETGSTSGVRQAVLALPLDAPSGEYQLTARCDDGTGPRVVANVGLTVVGPQPATTTSSTSSSTTTTTAPRATTSTTSSSTTSTTKPPKPKP